MTITVRTAAILLLVSVVSGFSRTVTAQDVAGDLDPRIVKLVASVSEERLSNILRKLQSFETRSSLSSTTSTTRGVGAARAVRDGLEIPVAVGRDGGPAVRVEKDEHVAELTE